MRRVLILFATLLVLWALVAELNHALSSLHMYLFAGGLFVSYAALHQPMREGLTATLLAALVCDANTPVAFGTHVLLFAAAHLTVFRLRDRIPREDNIAATILVLFTNFALFLLFSFTQVHSAAAPAAIWPRLIADLVGSQIFVALVTPWFFALQGRTLALVETMLEMRARRAG
jgi:rod shape-determining protein MreD